MDLQEEDSLLPLQTDALRVAIAAGVFVSNISFTSLLTRAQ
jgi:hypothetical protein